MTCFKRNLQQTTPIPTTITTPPINTEAPAITTAIPEITPFIALQLRVAKLEQDMSEVKKFDHSADVLASIQSQVPPVVDKYLGTKLDDALLKTLERHTADLVEKYSVLPTLESSKKQESEKSPEEIIRIKREQEEKKQEPTYTIKSTDQAALEEFDLKSALFKFMHKNKSANRNPANYRLYHALMEALIEDENAMDKEVADTVKDHKRKHDGDDDDDDDDEGPSAGSNQGKSTKKRRKRESESAQKPSTTKESSKGKDPKVGSKTGKSAPAKDPVEEPTTRPKWVIPPIDLPEAVNDWAHLNLPKAIKIQMKTKDYTIVFKPKAVIYKDMDDSRKMMRINKVHNFSDGTLIRIKEKLDFMVKDFKLFKFNRAWRIGNGLEVGKRRSEDLSSLAIRVLLIDPTAKNENRMIEDIQWSRSKAQGERSEFVFVSSGGGLGLFRPVWFGFASSGVISICLVQRWLGFVSSGIGVSHPEVARYSSGVGFRPTLVSFRGFTFGLFQSLAMSIHDFLCMPSLEKATVREEPHELGTSILSRVADHTTPPAPTGTAIPHASLEEIVVTRPDRNVVAKADHAAKRKTSTGPEISINTTKDRLGQNSGPGRRLYRLGLAVEDVGNLNDVGQDKEVEAHAELSGDVRKTTRASSHVSHGCVALWIQALDTDASADEIASDGNVDSYFDTRVSNTAGDVLERDLLSFVPRPYYIPYPYDENNGCESPPYTKDDWDEIHGVNLAKIHRLHKLSSREVGSLFLKRYAQQTQIIKKQNADLKQHKESAVHASEEVSGLKAELGALKSKCEATEHKLSSWDKKHRKYRSERDTLAKENAKMRIKSLSMLGYERQAEEIQGNITSFFQSDFTPLVRKFLKSSEFKPSICGVLNTEISVGVERGLHMGRTDEEFRGLSQRVAGFIPELRRNIAQLEPDRVTPSSQPSSATGIMRTSTRRTLLIIGTFGPH
ncbi:hypothetical protein Tco_0212838 [Tanacetum coccineum]